MNAGAIEPQDLSDFQIVDFEEQDDMPLGMIIGKCIYKLVLCFVVENR